jgi:CRP/FNR family transcriptional regulator, cyclic AMP receptor protein
MSLKDEVELLRRVPVFAQIEPARLKLLAFTSERVAYEAGKVLFHSGDMADAAYIIIEGVVEVIVEGPAGPVTVATIGKNDIVGEIAILCDVPRTATVKARERVVTLRISKELFLRLVNEFPQMAVAIMRELAHRLEHNNNRLREALAEVERLRKSA